jgi:hypothetical protein
MVGVRIGSTSWALRAFTLDGANTGYQRFQDGVSVGDTFPYCIANQVGTEWECGIGTLSAATTLTRTTVVASSNAGSAVNFSAGTKDIFLTYPAFRAVMKAAAFTSGRIPYVDSNGLLTDTSTLTYDGTAQHSGLPTGGFSGLPTSCAGTVNGTTAATGTVQTGLIVSMESSGGAGAAGFGVGIDAYLEDSTTVFQSAASLQGYWSVATHASRAGGWKIGGRYTGTFQTAIDVQANSGGSAYLGFYGATPVAQQSGAVGAGLVALGLFSSVSVSGTEFGSQSANKVFAAPSGSAGTPTFRSLVNADIAELLALADLTDVTGTTGTGTTAVLSSNPTLGGLTLTDNTHVALNTVNGSKIGTSTSQKLGFFNATPVVQQGNTTDLGTVLSNLGLRASGTAYPMTTSGAVSLTGGLTVSTAGITVTDVDIALGTTTGTKIGTSTSQKLSFYNKTPVVQPSSTGETAGFTGGSSTACRVDSTFTGNTGSTAYTLSDVVKHLKNLGLIAA